MSGMNPGFANYLAAKKSAKQNPTNTQMSTTAPKTPNPATKKGAPHVAHAKAKTVSAGKGVAKAGSVKLGTTMHGMGQGHNVAHPIC